MAEAVSSPKHQTANNKTSANSSQSELTDYMSILQSFDADFSDIDLVSGHNDIQVASLSNKMREPTDEMGFKYSEKWSDKTAARKRTGSNPRANAKSFEAEETDILRIEESLIEIAAQLESSNGSTDIPNTSKNYGDILNMATELFDLDSIADESNAIETFENVSSHKDYLKVSKKLEESNKTTLNDISSKTSSLSPVCKIVSVTSINSSNEMFNEKAVSPQEDSPANISESDLSPIKPKESFSLDESDAIVLEDLGIRLEMNQSQTSSPNNSEGSNASILGHVSQDEMEVDVIDIDELLLDGYNKFDGTDETIDVENIYTDETVDVCEESEGKTETNPLKRPSDPKQAYANDLINLTDKEHFETNVPKKLSILNQSSKCKAEKGEDISKKCHEKLETNAFKGSSSTKPTKLSSKSENPLHVSSLELKKRWTESFLSDDKCSKKKTDSYNKVNNTKQTSSMTEFEFKPPGTPMCVLKKTIPQKNNLPSTSSKCKNSFKVPNIPKPGKPTFKKSSLHKASKSQPKPFKSPTLAALEQETNITLEKRQKEILEKVSKIKGLTPFNLLDHLTEEEIIILGGEISEVCNIFNIYAISLVW